MNKISIKYGLIMFAGLMGYFFLMQGLGLQENYNYRIYNVAIQSVIIYLAIRSFAKLHSSDFTYLSGSLTGMFTTWAGAIPFAIFQMIDLSFRPEFMAYLQQNAPVVGPYLTPFTAGLIVLAESTAAGLVLSYIAMRIVDLREVSANKPYVKISQDPAA